MHTQLAAFFAFGSEDELEQYQPWLETWPRLEEFVEGMPLFWGDQLPRHLAEATIVTAEGATYEKRIDSRLLNLSPALSGTFTAQLADHNTNNGLLSSILARLTTHIVTLDSALPHLSLLGSATALSRFLHAWSCVNSRCFYYIPSPSLLNTRLRKMKPKPPADPNEAMALMPYLDLFNHTAPATTTTNNHPVSPSDRDPSKTHCKVKYNPRGFELTTQNSHPADTELHLSYGDHTNDTLWTEYGFLLLPPDTNASDSLDISEIVLQDLSPAQHDLLDQNGYLGSYTVGATGEICYRTEAAAWSTVLPPDHWKQYILHQNQDQDPSSTSSQNQQAEQNQFQTRFTAKLHTWLSRVKDSADANVAVLEQLGDEEMRVSLGTVGVVRRCLAAWSDERELAVVRRRREMVVLRWRQVGHIACRGIERFK